MNAGSVCLSQTGCKGFNGGLEAVKRFIGEVRVDRVGSIHHPDSNTRTSHHESHRACGSFGRSDPGTTFSRIESTYG